jgi:hypothetical protein
MDLPMTNAQISEFVQAENLMNYYMIQKYLSELVETGYLEKTSDGTKSRYTVTDDGLVAMDIFIKYVPIETRNTIIKYVSENRKTLKQDFEIVANLFFNHDTHEYIVKCGAYEDENLMMEINVSIPAKEQAVAVCNNWNQNVTKLYKTIIDLLVNQD